MIDTRHLLPPDRGPRSNPVLHGIAEAIAKLFPLIAPAATTEDQAAETTSAAESVEASSEGTTEATKAG
ncbi:hypothetical protein HCU64_10610 [Methylobacterium sp. C25]|uniref:hypothetical protein n=1 Tax=Methylobacterium sp. C25 TaxID=2721622 RepID=UPI001F2AE80E|nr:hypothetical protein [Methylobacterium sp. C25]MCE4224203.1 hypothetical protein [Methylobacterium sp. C25]